MQKFQSTPKTIEIDVPIINNESDKKKPNEKKSERKILLPVLSKTKKISGLEIQKILLPKNKKQR